MFLNNLSRNKRFVDIFKNGKGMISLKVFKGFVCNKNKKQTPQNLFFRCGKTHINYSSKKLGTTFKLQKEILKTELNHNEVYADTWKNGKNEWLDYVKNDVLCTPYSYARYSKSIEEITGFGMKDCLSLPGLGWKYLNSLRTEEDEPIYSYSDKYIRWFVRQSIKEGRVYAFNQYYKSNFCDDISNHISKELN